MSDCLRDLLDEDIVVWIISVIIWLSVIPADSDCFLSDFAVV
jgi:hypothetical protein